MVIFQAQATHCEIRINRREDGTCFMDWCSIDGEGGMRTLDLDEIDAITTNYYEIRSKVGDVITHELRLNFCGAITLFQFDEDQLRGAKELWTLIVSETGL